MVPRGLRVVFDDFSMSLDDSPLSLGESILFLEESVISLVDLTMSIDGPFGSKTNVFTIIKPIHKKSTSQSKLTPTEIVRKRSVSFSSLTFSNFFTNFSFFLQLKPAKKVFLI